MRGNNTQLKVQEWEIELSQAELSGALSGFLPQVSLSHTGYYTNDPLNVFGFKLQQKGVTQTDFDPVLLNDPEALYHFNTKFAIRQPLLNFDVFSARKAIKGKIRAAQYQRQFAEELLAVEIKRTYTDLQFVYEAKKAVAQGISAYGEVLRNTRNMEEQGLAKPADVLLVQVGLTEIRNREIEIDNNMANLSDYLSWLMGEDGTTLYVPVGELTQNFLLGDLSDISGDRADILAMKSGLEAREKMLSMGRNELLPRLNAFGEFNYNDKEVVGFGADGYMAGLSLSWDIFNGNQTLNKIKRTKIELEKARTELELHIEKTRLELHRAQRDLAAHLGRIELARTAKEHAAETLRIFRDRYAQGLEKTADLLVSQATDIEKRVNYLEAVKAYNLTVIQIEFLSQSSN